MDRHPHDTSDVPPLGRLARERRPARGVFARAVAACAFLAVGTGAAACRQVLAIDDGVPVLHGGDGGADAGDAGQPLSYCENLQPPPQFCADFDEGRPVIAGWDNTGAAPDPFVTGGATLALDGVHFHSAPSAAAVVIPTLLAPSTASVALVKRFASPPKNLVLDAAVRIDTEDFRQSGQVVMLFALTFPVGQIAVGRAADGLSLATFDEKNQAEARSSEPLPVGVWRRLSLLVTSADAGPDGAHVVLQVDGASAAVLPLSPRIGGSGVTYLGVGAVGGTGDMGAFRASYDDVSFTSDAAFAP